MIFSSLCDKENNNWPKEINFQIPEVAQKKIQKFKVSQAFRPQSHTALCKAKHNHSKQMQRSLGNVFLRSIYNHQWAKNKKLGFCNYRICWDKSWIKPLKKYKGLTEIKIGLQTLSRLTTLSSFYPTDTGSKPSRRPLGNDISLLSHLNDLSKTYWVNVHLAQHRTWTKKHKGWVRTQVQAGKGVLSTEEQRTPRPQILKQTNARTHFLHSDYNLPKLENEHRFSFWVRW